MGRRDLVLAVALAAALVVLVLPHPDRGSIAGRALEFLAGNWFAGVAMALAGVALARRTSVSANARLAARVIGVVGLAWVGFLATILALALLVALMLVMSPGY